MLSENSQALESSGATPREEQRKVWFFGDLHRDLGTEGIIWLIAAGVLVALFVCRASLQRPW